MNANKIFVLKNKNNLQAFISNYGARWVNMFVPDQQENQISIVAGFDIISLYKNPDVAYYGATIGRFANRITKGTFTLNDKIYKVDINNGPNHLHGGNKGFHAVDWEVLEINEHTILLSYLSSDKEEGYPGNLQVFVRYTLTDNNEMKIEYSAKTDQLTIINLTNHAYFNLNGIGNGTILNHVLAINADHYTPVDETLIPTGDIISVKGTPFDFRHPERIGARIDNNDLQLKYGEGYDHNFVINKKENELALAASVEGDLSKIKMDILTTEPGVQLYTGNFMNGNTILKGSHADHRRSAFCLETQHFPDSPNKKYFPSSLLFPDDIYKSTTLFRFYN
ncbi:MAG TPA: aldose epimerase family protein [Ferruginibacter sp.]|jgi:aldose 1-epimerase|nr:aldose epimerase family protein [Ferruginibacter sp.]